MPRCLNPLRYQFSRRSINQPSPPLRIASANFYKEMAEFLEASLSGPFSGSTSTQGENWKRLGKIGERLEGKIGKDWTPTKGKIGHPPKKERLDTHQRGKIGHPPKVKDWKDRTPTKKIGKRLDTQELQGLPPYPHGLPRMITYRLHHPRFVGGSDTKNLRIRVFSTIYFYLLMSIFNVVGL
jgi:hypothetical protein